MKLRVNNFKSFSLEFHKFSVCDRLYIVNMNLTLFGAIALFAFVSNTSAQFGPAGFGALFAPPAASGYLAGQDASKNAVDFAINNAITKLNTTELPPELQV